MSTPALATRSPRTLSLATFNLKDFFEPLAEEPQDLFEERLSVLGSLVARADADVIAFQEVGSAEALVRLFAKVGHAGYLHPFVGSADRRGIRNAVVSRIAVERAEVHVATELPFPTFAAGDAPPYPGRLPLRRGIVEIRIEPPGFGAVHVFGCHLKSRRAVPLADDAGYPVAAATIRERGEAELRSLVQRAAEALYVRRLVDERLAADADAQIAILGDLNDQPDSLPVRIIRGVAGGAAANGQGVLYGCEELVDASRRFSVLHGGLRQQIDHVLVSERLRAKAVAAEFLNESLREHVSFADDGPKTVDSDHAPFVVRFG